MFKGGFIFLEVIFLLGQIYILFNYMEINYSRYNYREFMEKINSYISKNKLDNDYTKRFEDVFGKYWDNAASGRGIIYFFISITHFCIGITLIIGVIMNFISACNNEGKIVPFCLFSYALVIAFFEFYNSFFEEKSDLKISQSELLEKFSPFLVEIQKNLDEVKNRILKLRIFTSILVVSSIFHLLKIGLFLSHYF